MTHCCFQDELVRELKQTLNSIKLEEKGVYVQASTLGSLEALLEFLRTSKVPVSLSDCFCAFTESSGIKEMEEMLTPGCVCVRACLCVCVCVDSMLVLTSVRFIRRM